MGWQLVVVVHMELLNPCGRTQLTASSIMMTQGKATTMWSACDGHTCLYVC